LTLPEENRIIELAKTDPKDFEPLYNYYFKKIFVFVLSRVGDQEVASDLTSQVFLKAIVNLKRYKYLGFRMSAWLMKIADNEVKHFFRKSNKVRNVLITDMVIANLSQTVENNNKETLLDALMKLLHTLEEEALQLIEMRFFEEMSFKEIGYILEITENNAKVRTYRLLDKLRNAMSHEEI